MPLHALSLRAATGRCCTLAHLHKCSVHEVLCNDLQADDACGQADLHLANDVHALKQPRNPLGQLCCLAKKLRGHAWGCSMNTLHCALRQHHKQGLASCKTCHLLFRQCLATTLQGTDPCSWSSRHNHQVLRRRLASGLRFISHTSRVLGHGFAAACQNGA